LGPDECADVQLADPWVSHRHCELDQLGAVLVVKDLGSKNGVFLQGNCRFSGVQDHTAKAKPACQRFGVFYDGLPNAVALQIGRDGHLPHLNSTVRARSKHKATDQPVATIAGDVVGILFRVQFSSGKMKAKGFA
jgi:hypothetical protein